MIRRIVVPLDGSAFGELALGSAIAVARRHGARVELTHVHEVASVVHLEGVPLIDAGVELDGLHSDRGYLERVRARVAALGVDTTASLLDGPTVAALEQRVEELGADLIVMSTHGRGPLSRAWLGSVADGLARHTARPLLMIRPTDASEAAAVPAADLLASPMRRVLLPVDDGAHTCALLDTALAVADENALITLLHVSVGEAASESVDDVGMRRIHDSVRRSLEDVLDDLRLRGHEARLDVVPARDVAGCILETATRDRADLIALTTHGQRALSRLFGSVTDKVLRGASVPVLIRKPARAG